MENVSVSIVMMDAKKACLQILYISVATCNKRKKIIIKKEKEN